IVFEKVKSWFITLPECQAWHPELCRLHSIQTRINQGSRVNTRHSHASRQIDSGANVKVVSDILGHRSSSSTSVYVRVALKRLQAVALPVPR
ncbi:MAG: tyrosine-type recombinase/integrase, partial [Bryobacteraceae bacterium]